MLAKELLDVLCCPHCKGELNYEPEKSILSCLQCKRVYPMKNDIPVMLVDIEGD